MSIRATWSTTEFVDIEVADEFTDQYGSTLDDGGVAILLGQDQDVFVIEGMDLSDLRAFINRLTDRVNAYAREHKNPGAECTCTNLGKLAPHDPECPIA